LRLRRALRDAGLRPAKTRKNDLRAAQAIIKYLNWVRTRQRAKKNERVFAREVEGGNVARLQPNMQAVRVP
jgi:hypothetical protein